MTRSQQILLNTGNCILKYIISWGDRCDRIAEILLNIGNRTFEFFSDSWKFGMLQLESHRPRHALILSRNPLTLQALSLRGDPLTFLVLGK